MDESDISCTEICKKAFRDMKGKWGFSFFIYGLSLFFLGFYLAMLYHWVKFNPTLPRLVPIIAYGYCLIMLPVGIYACHLDIARNSRLNVLRLFFGLQRPAIFFKILVVKGLLRMPHNEVLVPGSLIWFILIDHPEYSAVRVVQESRAIVYGYRIKLFKVYVMSMFIPGVSLVALAELYENLRFDAKPSTTDSVPKA